jgi:hypothetical protein
MSHLWLVALGTLVINVPFGYWRATTRKFSAKWITAIHAPVPAVVGMRLVAGVHWQLATLPILVGAYFGGQFLGTRIRGWRAGGSASRQ